MINSIEFSLCSCLYSSQDENFLLVFVKFCFPSRWLLICFSPHLHYIAFLMSLFPQAECHTFLTNRSNKQSCKHNEKFNWKFLCCDIYLPFSALSYYSNFLNELSFIYIGASSISVNKTTQHGKHNEWKSETLTSM